MTSAQLDLTLENRSEDGPAVLQFQPCVIVLATEPR